MQRPLRKGRAPAGPYYTDASRTTVYRTGSLDLNNACVAWTATGYRLPTEAEWEKAGRGGAPNAYFPGYDLGTNYLLAIFGPMGNFWNSGDPYDNGTTPVGFYNGFQGINAHDMQNSYGLYDMGGNVAELCWDWLAPYSAARQVDPRGPDTGDQRIARGGSWYEDYPDLRAGLRDPQYPFMPAIDIGFRCVRSAGL